MEKLVEKLWRGLKSKWFVIVAGVWIQCMSGSSYTFGLYSETLKSNLNYDQSTLDTISWCKDLGANIGIISGFLYGISYPWVVLLAGALQNCVGYGMIWLSVTHRIHRPALWQTCVYMFLAAHAQTFFNTAVVVTSVNNFPTYRGTVVGLMKVTQRNKDVVAERTIVKDYTRNQAEERILIHGWCTLKIARRVSAQTVINSSKRTNQHMTT